MTGSAPARVDLGTLRVQLYPSRFVGIILCVAAVISMTQPERAQFVYLAVALVVIGVCLITHVVALHDLGVRSSLAGGLYSRQIRFNEVVTLGYETSKVYINFAFAGLHTNATFVDSAGRKLSVKVLQPAQNPFLDAIRDHIAGLIAARWAETLRSSSDSSVPWSSSVAFTNRGLRVEPRGFARLRRVGTLSVPYESKLDVEVDKGTVCLLRDDQRLCTFQNGAPNFYPGFALLQHLRTASKESRKAKPVAST